MGCVGSSETDKGKGNTNEEPELMGKAKFLSCPALSEITDATQTKWLLLVFAPLTHHGLIFAARNTRDGTLLVKDVLDKQVTKEKEEQKVQLSYNLFFKAISTEVAKASRSGAKVEWLHDGSLSVECKIAISGSTSTNKKPDTYTAVLKQVVASEENLFKYIAEPLATHYCKKRTDGWNLDRPDPHREKLYGEQEANAIIRTASMLESQKIMLRELPQILPLRQEHATARAERDTVVAKVNLMKQMLLANSAEPPILQMPPEDAFAPLAIPDLSSFNLIAASQEPHIVYSTPAMLTQCLEWRRKAPPEEVPVPNLDDFNGFVAPKEAPLFQVGFAAFRALGLVGTEEGQINQKRLSDFLTRMDELHRPIHAFHNGRRAAERMHTMYHLLKAAQADGFHPPKKSLASALLAVAIHDADHCGLSNQHGVVSTINLYLPTLYSFESQVERHSLAVGIHELHHRSIPHEEDTVACMVLSTDLSKHQSFMLNWTRRVREVSDFGRRHEDRMHAFAALLKSADICHLIKTRRDCDIALEELHAEHRVGDDVVGADHTAPPDVRMFAYCIAEPLLSSVASAFPSTAFALEACRRNFPA